MKKNTFGSSPSFQRTNSDVAWIELQENIRKISFLNTPLSEIKTALENILGTRCAEPEWKTILTSLRQPAELIEKTENAKWPKNVSAKNACKPIVALIKQLKIQQQSCDNEEIKRCLANLMTYYETYVSDFERADSAKQEKLLESFATISWMDEVRYLSPAMLKKLLAGDNLSGSHVVTNEGGNYYKFNPINESSPADKLMPAMEQAVAEWHALMSGEGIAPTTILKIEHNEKIFYAQASKAMEGESLDKFLEKQIQPKFANYSSLYVTSLIVRPGDGKPDNYVVVCSKDSLPILVSIDSDVAFVNSLYRVKNSYEKAHGNTSTYPGLKDIIYCLPQRHLPVDSSFREHFLSKTPEVWLLQWVKSVQEQSIRYQQLQAQGKFTAAEMEMLNLPARFLLKEVIVQYQRLQILHQALKDPKVITHHQLFSTVEPAMAAFYEAVLQMPCDPEVVQKAKSPISSAFWKIYRFSPTLEAVLPNHPLPASLPNNIFAYIDERTATIQEALVAFLDQFSYAPLTPTDQKILLENLLDFQGLTSLKFSDCVAIDDDYLQRVSMRFPQLAQITLWRCQTITIAGLTGLFKKHGSPLVLYVGDCCQIDESQWPLMYRFIKERGHQIWIQLKGNVCFPLDPNQYLNLHCLITHDPEIETKIKKLQFFATGTEAVDARDHDGCTPLHLAAMRGQIAVVNWLLNEMKASVDILDREKDTALQKILFCMEEEIRDVSQFEKVCRWAICGCLFVLHTESIESIQAEFSRLEVMMGKILSESSPSLNNNALLERCQQDYFQCLLKMRRLTDHNLDRYLRFSTNIKALSLYDDTQLNCQSIRKILENSKLLERLVLTGCHRLTQTDWQSISASLINTLVVDGHQNKEWQLGLSPEGTLSKPRGEIETKSVCLDIHITRQTAPAPRLLMESTSAARPMPIREVRQTGEEHSVSPLINQLLALTYPAQNGKEEEDDENNNNIKRKEEENFSCLRDERLINRRISSSLKAALNQFRNNHARTEVGGVCFKSMLNEAPIELAVSALNEILAFEVVSPNTLIQIQGDCTTSFLATLVADGKLLPKWFEENGKNIQAIDQKSFSELFVLALLIHPNNWGLDNFVGTFSTDKKSIKLIALNNSQSLTYHEPIKNILFCFPNMEKALDPAVIERLNRLSPAIAIIHWLNNLGEVLLPAGCVERVYTTLCELKAVVAKNHGLTLQDIFSRMNIQWALQYRTMQTYSETEPEKFKTDVLWQQLMEVLPVRKNQDRTRWLNITRNLENWLSTLSWKEMDEKEHLIALLTKSQLSITRLTLRDVHDSNLIPLLIKWVVQREISEITWMNCDVFDERCIRDFLLKKPDLIWRFSDCRYLPTSCWSSLMEMYQGKFHYAVTKDHFLTITPQDPTLLLRARALNAVGEVKNYLLKQDYAEQAFDAWIREDLNSLSVVADDFEKIPAYLLKCLVRFYKNCNMPLTRIIEAYQKTPSSYKNLFYRMLRKNAYDQGVLAQIAHVVSPEGHSLRSSFVREQWREQILNLLSENSGTTFTIRCRQALSHPGFSMQPEYASQLQMNCVKNGDKEDFNFKLLQEENALSKNHLVFQLKGNRPALDFYFKVAPDHPMRELAAYELRQLFLEDAVPVDLLRWQFKENIYAVLLSAAVPGDRLSDALKRDPQLKLNHAKFSACVLWTILVNSEDENAYNFIVSAGEHGWDITNIDMERLFVSALFDHGKRVAVKSILFCFDNMLMPIDPALRERICSLEPSQLLNRWISQVELLQKQVSTLFDGKPTWQVEMSSGKTWESEIKWENLPVRTLFEKMTALKGYLTEYPNATLIELLALCEPKLANHYQRFLYDSKCQNPLARFEKAVGAEYHGILMNTLGQMIPRAPKRFSTMMSREMYEQLANSEGHYAQLGQLRGFQTLFEEAKSALSRGNIELLKQLKQIYNVEAVLKEIKNWNDAIKQWPAEIRQAQFDALFEWLVKSPVREIHLPYCPLSTEGIIEWITVSKDVLVRLNLTGYKGTKEELLRLLQLIFSLPNLVNLQLNDCKNLINLILPNTLKKLRYLSLANCKNLAEINFTNVSLETLDLTGCDPQLIQRGVEYFRSKAEHALSEQQLKEALENFQRAFQLDPENKKSLYQLGEIYYKRECYQEALEYLNKVIQKDEWYAEAFCYRGMTYHAMGAIDKASADFDKAIQLSPLTGAFRYQKGLFQYFQKNYAAACELFREAVERKFPPEEAAYWGGRSLLFWEKKNIAPSGVEIFYEQFVLEGTEISLEILEKSVQFQLSDMHKKAVLNQVSQAREKFTEAIHANNKKAPLFYWRGITNYLLDNAEDALTDFDTALSLDPKDVNALNQRALIRYKQKKFAEAIKGFSLALEQDPTNIGALQWRGLLQQAQQHDVEAEKDFSRILDLDSKNMGALYWRAQTRLFFNQSALAKQDLDAVIRLGLQNARVFYWRAISLYGLCQYSGALADFDRSIWLNPSHADAYMGRGSAQYHLQQYGKALRDFNESLVLEPGIGEALRGRGLAHCQLGHYAMALQDFSDAIRLAPQKGKLFYYRAKLQLFLGNEQAAFVDFDKALQQDKENEEFFCWRGFMHLKIKNYAAAIEDFRQSIVRKPKNLLALYGRGLAYLFLREYDAAIKDFEAIAPWVPGDEKRSRQINWRYYLCEEDEGLLYLRDMILSLLNRDEEILKILDVAARTGHPEEVISREKNFIQRTAPIVAVNLIPSCVGILEASHGEVSAALVNAIQRNNYADFFAACEQINPEQIQLIFSRLIKANKMLLVIFYDYLESKNLGAQKALLKNVFATWGEETFCELFPSLASFASRQHIVAQGKALSALQTDFLPKIATYQLLSLQNQHLSAVMDSTIVKETQEENLIFLSGAAKYFSAIDTLKEKVLSALVDAFGLVLSPDARSWYLEEITMLINKMKNHFPFFTSLEDAKKRRDYVFEQFKKAEKDFTQQEAQIKQVMSKLPNWGSVSSKALFCRVTVLCDMHAFLKGDDAQDVIVQYLLDAFMNAPQVDNNNNNNNHNADEERRTFLSLIDKKIIQFYARQFFCSFWKEREFSSEQWSRFIREHQLLSFQKMLLVQPFSQDALNNQYLDSLKTEKERSLSGFPDSTIVPAAQSALPFSYLAGDFHFTGFDNTEARKVFNQHRAYFFEIDSNAWSARFLLDEGSRELKLKTIENRLIWLEEALKHKETFQSKMQILQEQENRFIQLLEKCFLNFDAFKHAPETLPDVTEMRPNTLLTSVGISPKQLDKAGDSLLHWLFKQPLTHAHAPLCQLFLLTGCLFDIPSNEEGFVPFDSLMQCLDSGVKEARDALLQVSEKLFSDEYDIWVAKAIEKAKSDHSSVLRAAIEAVVSCGNQEYPQRLETLLLLLQKNSDLTFLLKNKITRKELTPEALAQGDALVVAILKFYQVDKVFWTAVENERVDIIENELSNRHLALQAIETAQKKQPLLAKAVVEKFVAERHAAISDGAGDTPLHHYLKKIKPLKNIAKTNPLIRLVKRWLYTKPGMVYQRNEQGIMPLHFIVKLPSEWKAVFYACMRHTMAEQNIHNNQVSRITDYLKTVESSFLDSLSAKDQTLLHKAVDEDNEAVVKLLLHKGLNPLLPRKTKPTHHAFQLAKDAAVIKLLQAWRIRQCLAVLEKETGDLEQLKPWLLDSVSSQAEFKVMSIAQFYFSDRQFKLLFAGLSATAYMTVLSLPATFIFDETKVHLLIKVLENNKTLTTLDLRYTGLTDAMFAQLLPCLKNHAALSQITGDFNQLTENSLAGLEALQKKGIHLSLWGNVGLSWHQIMSLTAQKEPPLFRIAQNPQMLYAQITQLLETHPLFSAPDMVHADETVKQLFTSIHALKIATTWDAVQALVEKIELHKPLSQQQDFVAWVYRLGISVLSAHRYSKYMRKESAVKAQFIHAFLQVMGQIETLESGRWESVLRTQVNANTNHLFRVWLEKGLSHFSRENLAFGGIQESVARTLVQDLQIAESKQWFIAIKKIYEDRHTFAQQNGMLAQILADYFLPVLMLLENEASENAPSSLEQMAFLMASMSLYSLCLRTREHWMMDALYLIRHVPWAHDFPLKNKLGQLFNASTYCRRAGFLISPQRETPFFATLKTAGQCSDVLTYGALPLLPQEKNDFEKFIQTEENATGYMPHRAAIKTVCSTNLLLHFNFDAKALEESFWPTKAVQQLLEKAEEKTQREAQQKQIAEKAEAILRLERENQEQKKVIAEQEKTIAQHEGTISQHEGTIAQHEGTIAQHEGTIANRNETIVHHEKTIADHEGTISQHEKTIADREETIEHYKKALAEKDALIAQLLQEKGSSTKAIKQEEKKVLESESYEGELQGATMRVTRQVKKEDNRNPPSSDGPFGLFNPHVPRRNDDSDDDAPKPQVPGQKG